MYDGKKLYWLEWIALFMTSVHDVELSVSARAGALRAALDPASASICVTQYATEDGYKRTLLALKKRFGDRTVLRVGLTKLLLGLQPCSSSSSRASIRTRWARGRREITFTGKTRWPRSNRSRVGHQAGPSEGESGSCLCSAGGQ